MKILIIGGTYFAGLVFMLQSYELNEVTLINRGNRKISDDIKVKHYRMDRHDISAIKQLPKEEYDVVVDFCAYDQGDILTFIGNYPGRIKRYIFVSTVDVYERNTNCINDENTMFSKTRYPGQYGDYIYGKICLEREIVETCKKKDIEYVSVRPCIIYGPFNYAVEREIQFITRAVKGKKIGYPKKSTGRFQLLYVKDLANALLKICEKENIQSQYNICPNEIIGYNEFANAIIEASDIPIQFEDIEIEQATEAGIILPFPLTKEETNLYDGSRFIEEFNFKFTSLEDGMKKTYQFFKNY